MNLLFTLDAHYIHLAGVAACIAAGDQSRGMPRIPPCLTRTSQCSAADPTRCVIESYRVQDAMLSSAPIVYRYPREMYYRLIAARFLPQEMDRILYLDPDIVVINPCAAYTSLPSTAACTRVPPTYISSSRNSIPPG